MILSPFFLKIFRYFLGFSSLVFSCLVFGAIAPPSIDAKAWMVFDVNSQQVLASYHSDEKIEPASLTKLMSTYIVFDALKNGKITLDQMVLPSTSIYRVKKDESRSFIIPKKSVSVDNLLHGMITQSGNDATIVLAELVAGSESNFVEMMNLTARQLGMHCTNYTNVNGMPDPNHYTTVQDLGRLAYALICDFPDFYHMFSEKEFSYNNVKQTNRNRLLWLDKTVDGLKTGYTKNAGYCLIATAKRTLFDFPGIDRRVITILMGAPNDYSRSRDSLKLLDYAYEAFRTVKLHEVNRVVQAVPVYRGKDKIIELGSLRDQFVTLPIGESHVVEMSLLKPKWVVAPIQKGSRLAIVRLTIDGKKIKHFPLIALKDIPLGNFLKQVKDSFWLVISKL